MTAEIVNLRRFRKQKERATKAADASANRAKSGRSKAERAAVALTRNQLDRALDGAARQPVLLPSPANSGSFPTSSEHDDEDLDPGNVS